ncbi:g2660 [Coccomyxa elongata]
MMPVVVSFVASRCNHNDCFVLDILEDINLVEDMVRHLLGTRDMNASETTLKATLVVATSKENMLLSSLSKATPVVGTSKEGILLSSLSQAMADRQRPAITHPLSSSLTATAAWGRLHWELWAAQVLALCWAGIMGSMAAAMALAAMANRSTSTSTSTCVKAAALAA